MNHPEILSLAVAHVLRGRQDLLKPEYRGRANPLEGHCYVAAEALYHLVGGKRAGWTAVRGVVVNEPGVPSGTHWWIENERGQILDPTSTQFDLDELPAVYSSGKRAGFLTREPSRRARIVIDLVNGDAK